MPTAARGPGTDPRACLEAALTHGRTPLGRSVDWRELGVRDAGDLLALLPPVLPFATSGTTGTPRRWWRTREQLVAEAERLAALLAPARSDAVLVHAPLRHLYGLLLGALVPALLGLPAYYRGAVEPPRPGPHRPLVVAVPSTWSLLKRSLSVLRGYRALTVVHSTGRLPVDSVRRVRRAAPSLALYEVHGSTETGMIAVRTTEDGEFALADDVELTPGLAPGRTVPLSVRGARLARPDGGPPPVDHVLDDLVRVTGPRAYRLVGRAGRIVKIDGRRADLAAVEATLRAAVPGLELACVLVPDPVRGEWYEVRVRGSLEQRRAVVDAAARLLPAWQAPRAVLTEPHPPRRRSRAL
ncbi:AMP-binding protein [Allostreptomyces psammosilenae]|uniref:Acyl-coenzyme A synthetase/AMP-(Fatty) acid ligase n=1 Tax=Allostreptomyces psammosilenae TaxID=1892865 RepID=A0A852ZXN3_9ACTN|nr:class I adenylate-forming enzyme family protein [Allostreptomyces psammosilenae]NYI06949.1 acyl-coenzyme A synthetase/AMP-(fatty) acid ligase [Allostreptomyces psammosilenae]